jgi:RimJ/RimL family protein N-acetyltransferase
MRQAVESDSALYCDLYGDPGTMRFVGAPLPRERAQRSFRKVLASLARRPIERELLVIVEKATRQSIGISAFQDFDTRRRRVEAGMMLTSAARGRGFGSEGLRALVDFAFATFEVDEVWIQHAADNMEARRVPISLGLTHNRDGDSGKLSWFAQRHSWPAHGFSRRIKRNASDVERN